MEKIRIKTERRNKRKKLVVDEAAVAETISDWTKIPLQKLTEEKPNVLLVWRKNFINV